ncbi:MAG: exo-beta-N-acetylmuramidase NamZ family protein [Bacteroidia bacterium]
MTNFFRKAKILIYAALLLFPFGLQAQITPGADQISKYLPLLAQKRVGLIVNQTSVVGKTHLLDTLLALKVNVKKVFAPEHGFRGDFSAGATVKDAKDIKTGLPIISLYGKNKKPSKEMLADIDILIFDIQDVGVRYYTYISTMHYAMEACADQKKTLLILDRPNPNGFYFDGPILEPEFKSFVGMHPIPLVHGLTVGELAQMINGEKWLAKGKKCNIKIIPVANYAHHMTYKLPVAPSPNLPTMESIYLYPSLGLFEGTDVSVGRGTEYPFEIIGKPGFEAGTYEFTPKSIPGKAEDPPYKDKACKGFKLTTFADEHIVLSKQLYLYWLEGFYKAAPNKDSFFTPFFDKLAGTDKLRKAFQEGKTPEQIHESWKPALENYRKMREKYLLYKL